MKKCNEATDTVGKATVARTGRTSVKLFESERFKDMAWRGKGRRSMLWRQRLVVLNCKII
jgi:hypothetical protein